jgi:acyl carrier protein
MSIKQEALAAIQEHLGDKSIKYTTTITALGEEFDTDLQTIVELLQPEFEVELDEDLLVDVETVGEVCNLVAKAAKEQASDDDT